MHPAFSVIFFTTVSGTGYGVLIWTALLAVLNTNSFLNTEVNFTFVISSVVGITLVAAGLISSLFHLANPKNSWRAVMRFKTSWLAREGIFAILSFPIVAFFIASFFFGFSELVVTIMAILVMLISILTIFSTGMIYACLKTIRAWNSPLVPINYIFLGLLTGLLLLISLLSYFQIGAAVLEISLMIVLIFAFIGKAIYYIFIGSPSTLTVKNATGIAGKTVRLLDTGESSDNFLTKEFGYVVSKNKIYLLRVVVFIMAFIIPSIILISSQITVTALIYITIINYLGTFVERWLFFAEGKHIVNLFYGRDA